MSDLQKLKAKIEERIDEMDDNQLYGRITRKAVRYHLTIVLSELEKMSLFTEKGSRKNDVWWIICPECLRRKDIPIKKIEGEKPRHEAYYRRQREKQKIEGAKA